MQGWAVLAVAIALRLYQFPDLTIEGSFTLGAATFAMFTVSDAPRGAAWLAGLMAGGLAGFLTATLNARFGVNRFLAGIAMTSVAYAMSLRVMGSSNVSWLGGSLAAMSPVGTAQLGRVAGLSALAAVGVLVIPWAASRPLGLASRVAGQNMRLARALGIPGPLVLGLAIALTNALAALGGMLQAQTQGFVDVGMGVGLLLSALAAIGIGEAVTPARLPLAMHVVVSSFVGSVGFQAVALLAARAGFGANDFRLIVAVMTLVLVVPRASRRLAAGAGEETS